MVWPLQESKCLKKWPALECRNVITIKITITIFIAPKAKTPLALRHIMLEKFITKARELKICTKNLSKREI